MSSSFVVYKGSESGKVVKSTTEKPALKGDQVKLRVTASGLCGTDLHYTKADMGLGHEGVGIVEELGPDCKSLKKGDRVGWGYEHDSCGSCQECLRGNETFCADRAMYGMADLDQGSMAEGAVWREAFLFKIPNDMSDEVAAPLMCGGATVFNALHAYNVLPTDVVGVMGVGGLGHLAIQYAAKMGCRVVVFSGSDSKKDEAMRLGASEFVAMKGASELSVERKVNRLLVTTSAQPDWKLLIPVLAPCATIFPLSVAGGDFAIDYMGFLINGLTIQASLVASRYIQNRMLEFSAHHKIAPIIEKFPLTEEGCNQAVKKLADGEMRYRGVLVRQ